MNDFVEKLKNFSFNLTPANMLGLGAAATPAGLMAFKELEKLEEERREEEEKEIKRKEVGEGRTKSLWKETNWKKMEENPIEKKQSKRKSMRRGTASNEMCTFLILNISSLQLIPVNIIAYRSQYGSQNPAAIVGPAIAATLASTLAAVVFCKVMDRKKLGD